MNRHTILLADDHQLILDGLVKILSELPQIEKILTANNGKESLEHPGLDQVSLVVSDIEMPVMNGIDLLRNIKQQYPHTKVLMLTMHNDAGLVKEILKIGADGYMLKSANEQEMHFAVSAILQGKKYFSQDVTLSLATTNIAESKNKSLLDDLTQREKEVLILIAQGFSNKQIGEKLFIAPKTVDTHRTNLMAKLDIHNTAGLPRFAISQQLI